MTAAELRGGNKPSLNEALGWIGSRVDDIYGASIGTLEDVWIDPATGVPRWLLVNEGRFGGRTTLIPFEDATAGAGHVWIPYEGGIVRSAPQIEPGAPLTHHVEASLRSHYASHAPSAFAQSRQPAPSPSHQVHPPSPSPPPSYEQAPPAMPPVQLPSRPPPPVAAEPTSVPHSQGGGGHRGQQAPPAQPYQARERYDHEPHQQREQHAYEQRNQAQGQGQPADQQWRQPPAREPSARSATPTEALQRLAGSAETQYVEIELSGDISIRGELRSIRIVPRDG